MYAYIETDSPAKVEELVDHWFENWKNINFMDLFYLKLQLFKCCLLYLLYEYKGRSVL